jgi:hypothetical protein
MSTFPQLRRVANATLSASYNGLSNSLPRLFVSRREAQIDTHVVESRDEQFDILRSKRGTFQQSVNRHFGPHARLAGPSAALIENRSVCLMGLGANAPRLSTQLTLARTTALTINAEVPPSVFGIVRIGPAVGLRFDAYCPSAFNE